MDQQHLQRKIMRRVYTLYARRLLLNPVTLHLAVFLLAAGALAYTVSIPNVIRNFLNQPVRETPHFIFNAVTGTEFIVVLILGVLIMTALSFQVTIRQAESRFAPAA